MLINILVFFLLLTAWDVCYLVFNINTRVFFPHFLDRLLCFVGAMTEQPLLLRAIT